MRKQNIFTLAAVAACLVSFNVQAAGGHWLVDDAAVFPPGTLGFETWYENQGDSVDGVVLQPAYAFSNGLELTGVIESWSFGNGREETYGFEVKGLWRDFEGGDDFGIGWVVGTRNDNRGSLDELFAYVPVTFPLADGSWLLNLNAGWMQDRRGPDSEGSFFYGVGSQYVVTPAMELIGELFTGTEEDVLAQVGARFALGDAPGLLDVSYARNLDNTDEDWFTLGFAWEI